MADRWNARHNRQLTRWRFTLCLALVAGVSTFFGCGTAEKPTGSNLLLITVDTLRADRLACYGGEPDVGEAICAIASTGTRALWAFSTAASTVPAVSSIMTSQYRFEHGVLQKPDS